jgi:site-specific DNA-methyltransferase (adenine-specific)
MMELSVNKIICGDCIEVMKTMPADSIDTIITDPPYGLGFMGKDWDTFNPEKLQISREKDLRRKSRTDGRNVKGWDNASDAGSYDYSRNNEYQNWCYQWVKEALRVAKPGAILLCFGGSRTSHRIACAIEDAGWQIRDCIMWLYGSGFPKSLDISKAIDKAVEAKRKRELKFSGTIKGGALHAGKENGNARSWNMIQTNEPATDLAKFWSGWGTALKPAFEPIIVAMKPIEGTFAENAQKWGVAGLNIDGGRIEIDSNEALNSKDFRLTACISDHIALPGADYNKTMTKRSVENPHPLSVRHNIKGRWPANVILDGEAAAMLDEQSGESKSVRNQRGDVEIFKKENSWIGESTERGHNDSGGASRFFYTAKADRTERNVGLYEMEDRQTDEGRRPENPGGNNPRNRGARQVKNNHPTVKPLDLMEYLCRLTKTPSGGIVLDPFMGSGTTALACINTDRDFIGIDISPDYCRIAEARIKAVETGVPIKEQAKNPNQKGLFEIVNGKK